MGSLIEKVKICIKESLIKHTVIGGRKMENVQNFVAKTHQPFFAPRNTIFFLCDYYLGFKYLQYLWLWMENFLVAQIFGKYLQYLWLLVENFLVAQPMSGLLPKHTRSHTLQQLTFSFLAIWSSYIDLHGMIWLIIIIWKNQCTCSDTHFRN